MDNDLLYHGTNNQTHCSVITPFIYRFFSVFFKVNLCLNFLRNCLKVESSILVNICRVQDFFYQGIEPQAHNFSHLFFNHVSFYPFFAGLY